MVTIYHCYRHLCLAVLETQRGDCESSLHEALRIEAVCCWLFSFTSFAIENLLPIYQINITHGGLGFLIYVGPCFALASFKEGCFLLIFFFLPFHSGPHFSLFCILFFISYSMVGYVAR